MQTTTKIYVAGHRGMVGSAIVRQLLAQGFAQSQIITRTHAELDLTNQAAVQAFFASEKPTQVYLAAARVGGIHANSTYPVQFLSENLQIEANLIDGCHAAEIERVLFLGSSCIYPKNCPQPIKEEYLLTGALEPTNEAYAIAKIAGLKLIQAYRQQFGHKWISAMPTNLYGPGDNFDLQNSHVLPALIRKFHEAKLANAEKVTLWGSGTPRREFLHADDLAAASLFLLSNYDGDIAVNIGTGTDLQIVELASLVASVTGYVGQIEWDSTKPDGTMKKQLDVSLMDSIGWRARINLDEGLLSTYRWYLDSRSDQPSRR